MKSLKNLKVNKNNLRKATATHTKAEQGKKRGTKL